jgi:DNA adenine methylase
MKVRVNPRPFLKWVGGKTQLLDELVQRMPARFEVYHEPFLGGGALFFCLYRMGKIKHAVLSDVNAELVDTYIAVRDYADEVLRLLYEYPCEKGFYYQLRDKDLWSMSLVERAARMIYLNKTCYNGLYRMNREGKFNAAFGRPADPPYVDVENFRAVSEALQHAEILCRSFEIVLERANSGDWVYCDPPYVPVAKSVSRTLYTASGFEMAEQERLRDMCVELSKRKVYVMVSNSDAEVVHNLYALPYFTIDRVYANRTINIDTTNRGKVAEVVITNYSVQGVQQLSLYDG